MGVTLGKVASWSGRSGARRALTAAQALAARVGARLVSSAISAEAPLVLVFSKDSAIQLELFLRSYAQQLSRPLPLTVLYRASSEAHRQAYEQVFAAYPAAGLTAIAEEAFKPDLLRVLKASSARKVIFFLDDVVFIQPVDTRILEGWDPSEGVLSLRLGRNITHSFDRGGVEQAQPAHFEDAPQGDQLLARWKWIDGQLDWALPISLDGHLLPLPELIPVIEQSSFQAPDSLEEAIGQFKFLFKWRQGYCYQRARIMKLPLERLNSGDADLAHAGKNAEALLESFAQGYRLDVSTLPLAQHNSCHMDWMPTLAKPPSAG